MRAALLCFNIWDQLLAATARLLVSLSRPPTRYRRRGPISDPCCCKPIADFVHHPEFEIAHPGPARIDTAPGLRPEPSAHPQFNPLAGRMASPSASQLRLMSDLKAINSDPPDGCSASPISDDNL